MKTDKDKIVWSHMTTIPFPQKCIRPELIRPCRACFCKKYLQKLFNSLGKLEKTSNLEKGLKRGVKKIFAKFFLAIFF